MHHVLNDIYDKVNVNDKYVDTMDEDGYSTVEEILPIIDEEVANDWGITKEHQEGIKFALYMQNTTLDDRLKIIQETTKDWSADQWAKALTDKKYN